MYRQIVAVIVATLVAVSVTTGIALADSSVLLGGGAGIIVNGTNCTLATIGHDSSGQLIGLTAATCGGPGSPVDIEAGPRDVGNVVAANDGLNYAVIKFDPAKVMPTALFSGFPVNGIGPDPGPGQTICTQGAATGPNCGFIKFGGPTPGILATDMPAYQPGDNGAPVTVDRQLVGLTRHGFTGPVGLTVRTHTSIALISAILGDINAKGGPGIGFTPT